MSAPALPWRELEQEVRPFVARRVDPADVDDVVQETFLRMHRNVSELRDGNALRPWLYRIARNAVMDHHRRRASTSRTLRAARDEPTTTPEELTAAPSDTSETPAAAEMVFWMRPFVSQLPEPYREAIILADLQGVPQQELASRLGLSPSGARTRVQRGRKRLRELIEACCRIALDARGRPIGYEPRVSVCACTPEADAP